VNQYSPAGQVGFVAAAIIPTIVLYVGYWFTPNPENPYLAAAELAVFCLLYGVYFVAIIRLVNRYPQRRSSVAAAAILTVLVDTAVSCAPELPMFHITETALNIAYVAITVAYVAVWGVARRQSKSWMFGLPFAAAVSWAAQFGLYQHPGRSYWWEPLTAFVGTFVVGCLICWGFDLLGRRLTSRGEAPGS
jgi:predicted benzoate:H+ symporter BenE